MFLVCCFWPLFVTRSSGELSILMVFHDCYSANMFFFSNVVFLLQSVIIQNYEFEA